MSKIKVAVYDSDRQYREKFADYLMSYKSQEIELSVFTGISFLLEALSVDNYHLAVLGNGYEEVLPHLRSRSVSVLVLTDTSYSVIKEKIGIEEESCSFTSKYQSMDEITRQMFLLTESEIGHMMTQTAEVIGVISPIRHEMQLPFSLLYLKNLSEKAKVLYLNLMEFSGFYEIFGEKEYDISDVILSMREAEKREISILPYIYEWEGISYICPPGNPEDVKEIRGSEICKLIKYAVEKLRYEVVLVDMGGMLADFSDLLQDCTQLYCIGKSGGLFAAQQKQFLSYVKGALGERYQERIKEAELPRLAKTAVYGENLLEQLNWSEFGDYVRKQIGGEVFVDR